MSATPKPPIETKASGAHSLDRLVRCPEHARHDHACPICARVRADRLRPARIWCSLCKTWGDHYSTECPTPLGMTSPNAAPEPRGH